MPKELFDINKVDTGFLNLYLESKLYLGHNSVIRNITASNCAVISAMSQSSIEIDDNVSFLGNNALLLDNAATICLSNTQDATIN